MSEQATASTAITHAHIDGDQALSMPDFAVGELLKKTIAPGHGTAAQMAQLAAELSEAKDAAEAYRKLQSVQLTQLQYRLLDSISDAVLSEASLRDIISAFKVLKDKELVAEGRPTEIHGLVGYLALLEKEEETGELQTIDITPASPVPPQSTTVAENQLDLPCL